MSGKRLSSFRAGDRSEYLAHYLFTRFSYCIPSLRQEDFGVTDFLCVLSRNLNRKVYPENEFYVQVKSNEDDIVFDADASRWISYHMNLPLFIGVINKTANHLKLYSTSKIWVGLFMMPNPQTITIKLNVGTTKQTIESKVDTGELVIELGAPILSLTIDEIENDSDLCRSIIMPWIEIDRMNISRRNIGRMFCSFYMDWKPNELPQIIVNQYTYGKLYPEAEKHIAQILTALAFDYDLNKQNDRLECVSQFMLHFEEHLDAYGIGFVERFIT